MSNSSSSAHAIQVPVVSRVCKSRMKGRAFRYQTPVLWV